MSYKEMTKEELQEIRKEVAAKYDELKAKGLKLDMSRGKPNTEQLDISMGMIDTLTDYNLVGEQGVDCRNYGVLDGIIEAKRLLSAMIECPVDNIIIYGNSSLNVMYDTVARSMTHGVMGSTPWAKLDKVKGIWCVPKYSNPMGITYSDETVRRFANLKPAAEDFRIYWDNAYCIHHLYEDHQDHILEILEECEKAGNPDMVFKFCSTSKVTFPGSGIAAISASKANLDFIKKQMSVQTIGHDKLNQLRHARFFGDFNGMLEHMKKHADIIRPKFEAVLEMLDKELGDLGIAKWTKPNGGYFIGFDTMDGCAKKVVAMCKEAGVVMTPAGATYPYGKDPHDSNIRIAPTFPSTEELKQACEIFVTCVKLVSLDKILETK